MGFVLYGKKERAYMHEWYMKNKERRNAYFKEWYQKNKEWHLRNTNARKRTLAYKKWYAQRYLGVDNSRCVK